MQNLLGSCYACGMSNDASDYLTGDDMIEHLIAGMDGASEGATYAPDDTTREALIARNRELLAGVAPVRGALIDSNAFYGGDARALELGGLIATYYGPGNLRYYLTDTGAAVAAAVRNV